MLVITTELYKNREIRKGNYNENNIGGGEGQMSSVPPYLPLLPLCNGVKIT